MTMMAQPWWPLSPWLSPGAAWFIFFNAVVAAIAVMSSCTQQQEQDGQVPASSRRRLCRSASSVVLHQLRSFSLFSVHPTAGGVTLLPLDDLAAVVSDSDYHHCSKEAEPVPAVQVITEVVVPETPRQTEPVARESVRMAAPAMASSAPAATVSATEPASVPESEEEEADAEEEQDKSIGMDEAYAMVMVQQRRLQRQSPSASPAAVATTNATSWPQKKKDPSAKGPKPRRGREAEEASEGKAELNARAELFIRQFREELKLQRLNSLLRHTHAFGSVEGAPVTVR